MPIALYSLSSSLHKGMPETGADPFILGIEACLDGKFRLFGEAFSTYGEFPDSVIFVRTGGTEDLFRQLGLTGHIRLLTSGGDNSLAAAMEILSFIRQNGGTGEIIHGTCSQAAESLRKGINHGDAGRWIRPFPGVDLGGARLGVIGHPSDWLISSSVDYAKVKSSFNAEMVDVGMDELISEIMTHKCDMRSFEGSEAIYMALCRIVERYRLDGLTIRCFDLLDSVRNTGCLALARLNTAGIPSSCEGDIPALLTMMTAYRKTGCPGFQCNLSRIEGDDLLFAHCTVPLSMVTGYSYDTHFESGIGTAIKGKLPEGDVTIFKIAPDLENMVAIPARLTANRSETCLCRTQVVVNAPDAAGYFLNTPLANHHVIVPGAIFQEGKGA